MKKTYCNKCLFAKPVSSNSACEFKIPESILEVDNTRISIMDDYYTIENYNCLYGLSKNQYESNIDNIKDIDIKNIIIKKAELKYYLIIDARDVTENNFKILISSINELDIKPTKLSILINPEKSEEFYQLIRKKISCPKWTVHVFLKTLSFNDCINIVLDTNLPNCGAWCVLFLDGNKLHDNDNININLENIVNYLHNKIIIQQTTHTGFINDNASLHALCLNCSLYKYLTSVVANDILKGISILNDIKLQNYETT